MLELRAVHFDPDRFASARSAHRSRGARTGPSGEAWRRACPASGSSTILSRSSSDAPESSSRQRSNLDAGSPPRFAEVALVYFRARASFAFHLDARDRKRLFADIADALERGLARLDLGPGWSLDVAAIAADLRRRVADLEAWRAGLVTRDDILGGEPVFPGSRLAVRHVGEMLARGAEPAEVREDYPYLTERDLELARLFAVAYPRIGRPRGQAAPG